ncbi:hypothetical protein EMEDMD4_500039 [Sinorhizobium medicae]|uniref:Uncharacterized protein n=1 Tax=Sinorhizobium medicae TaxID=110321 RepID=A0A508X6P7_9HYPH|nr:hypothetical protein EMEDMD4_500039 [Sinorhizobium medicae]
MFSGRIGPENIVIYSKELERSRFVPGSCVCFLMSSRLDESGTKRVRTVFAYSAFVAHPSERHTRFPRLALRPTAPCVLSDAQRSL